MVAKRPEKNCDLVMKGGVTSGVVYPKAIFELSKEYRFSSIGGTSAGAIAAVATAALGKSGAAKWLAIFWVWLREFPIAALIGIAPGLLMAWLAFGASTEGQRWLGLMLAVATGVVGLALALILGAGVQIAVIPKHAWGVCSGMTEGGHRKSPALVP